MNGGHGLDLALLTGPFIDLLPAPPNRPAVKRGRMVNRIVGDPASQLRERHEATDFDTKTQEKVAAAG
jgi:hypothetical protein